MKDKEMPICVNCVHAYVCEEYNLNRDMLRKRCAYHNDHFLDIEQHDREIKEQAVKEFVERLKDENANLVEEESFKDLSIVNKLIEENRVLKIENENAQKALHNYLQPRKEIEKETAEKILNEITYFAERSLKIYGCIEEVDFEVLCNELARRFGTEIKE